MTGVVTPEARLFQPLSPPACMSLPKSTCTQGSGWVAVPGTAHTRTWGGDSAEVVTGAFFSWNRCHYLLRGGDRTPGWVVTETPCGCLRGAGHDTRRAEPGTTTPSTLAQADGPVPGEHHHVHHEELPPSTFTSWQADQPPGVKLTGTNPARTEAPEAVFGCKRRRFVRRAFRNTGRGKPTMRKDSLSVKAPSGFGTPVARARDWLKHHFRPTVVITVHGPDGTVIETITSPPPWRLRLDGLLRRLTAPWRAFRSRHGKVPARQEGPVAGQGGAS